MGDNIHRGHRYRLKKRLVEENDKSNINDVQLMELLLFYCRPQVDTNPLAHKILDQFGNRFSAVFDKPYHELIKIDGVTEHTATGIILMGEIARRIYNDKLDPAEKLDSTQKIYKYLKPKFLGLAEEHVYCLCLDNNLCPISCEQIARGIPNQVHVMPRQVIEILLKHKAVNVILAHNHPQGSPLPSHSDIDTTKDIKNALETMNMKLVDHFVLSKDDYIALVQGKWI